ncbi:hypothetical protein Zm00014a_036551 [Zea mays]|jgi:hypothetical protein|uniref:Uncharacterized protein n=2 Tax=Zea mays TaxID=4577 RepID=C0P6G7_MAIZE|nr:uncharacterized protein LOC100277791 precursor [Zea mays]ACN28583.1 unknown [Zea mays]ONM33084.1 hypothetical protein ZEAMMB73_Zm00001d041465 [Zea mays]PWZ33273.1 hypothetical protein Zm00014a_036551 [Zea mays]|eukprot:NP_001168538.1 uncharacterized protein LOC100277791 precursor [Zea mays]
MHHHHRGRCRLAALVAAALCLVAAHEGTCAAAARRLHAVEEVAVLDVAAEAPDEAARWPGGGDALGEAKWLPMSMPLPGGLRFPPVTLPLAGASMPWLQGPVRAGGALPALVPSFVGATRQEQLSLWASLFNPFQARPRLPVSLGGETAGHVERGGVSAVASGGKATGEQTLDAPGRVTFHESSVENKHESLSQSTIGDDDDLSTIGDDNNLG